MNLEQLIPQRPPMRMIDEFIQCEDQTVHCRSHISAQHLFFCHDKKSVPHWVAVEMMAQTAAVYARLYAQQQAQDKGEPKVAFLMSVRQYKTEVVYYAENTIVDTYAECILIDNQVGVFDCRCEINGQRVASVKVSAYQPEDSKGAMASLTRSGE